MKYILTFLFFELIIITTVLGQVGWTQHITTPTDHGISGCSSTNKNNCTIVYDGRILRTTDAGKSWTTQHIDANFTLWGVCFTDSLNGTVIGSYGTILRTTDAGVSWVNQKNSKNGLPTAFRSVCFSDSLHGIVVGDFVLQTSNAGKTWIERNGHITHTLWCVSLADSLNAFAVGGGAIIQTQDGGKSWIRNDQTTVFDNYYPIDFFSSVSFHDLNNATFVGDNGILIQTSDLGKSWTHLENPLISYHGDNLTSVSFSDKLNGTITGSEGAIWRTTNGGNSWSSWSKQISGAYGNLDCVSFSDPNNGFAVGANGTLLHTTNGGVNWVNLVNGTGSQLTAVSFTDVNTGTAVGLDGVILRTTDGGVNWEHQYCGEYWFGGVCFSDINNGTIIGYNGDNSIFHTSDGGKQWVQQDYDNSSENYISLVSLSFVDANVGIIVGTFGSILKTTNGGNNWINQSSNTKNNLFGVKLFDENIGVAVGEKGTILRTEDGGLSWNKHIAFDSTITFDDVTFIDTNTLYIVGENGIIGYTTDGGQIWYRQQSGSNERLRKIGFSDANNGFVLGGNYDSFVLRTTDGGNHWGKQIIGRTDGNGVVLNSISVVNANMALAVGLFGYIFITKDGGGLVSVNNNGSNLLPARFNLTQNYPNPFNPTTTINYSVAKAGLVSIKVYDLLGREIVTLVNENKSIGNYRVQFNAANFVSGIYFYQLKSDEYIQTKKMLLLK
jgi:photosystem II stability/assembly factor-like uncharacterized protein